MSRLMLNLRARDRKNSLEKLPTSASNIADADYQSMHAVLISPSDVYNEQ